MEMMRFFGVGIALGYPDEKHPANSFRTDREDFDNYAKIIE